MSAMIAAFRQATELAPFTAPQVARPKPLLRRVEAIADGHLHPAVVGIALGGYGLFLVASWAGWAFGTTALPDRRDLFPQRHVFRDDDPRRPGERGVPRRDQPAQLPGIPRGPRRDADRLDRRLGRAGADRLPAGNARLRHVRLRRSLARHPRLSRGGCSRMPRAAVGERGWRAGRPVGRQSTGCRNWAKASIVTVQGQSGSPRHGPRQVISRTITDPGAAKFYHLPILTSCLPSPVHLDAGTASRNLDIDCREGRDGGQ